MNNEHLATHKFSRVHILTLLDSMVYDDGTKTEHIDKLNLKVNKILLMTNSYATLPIFNFKSKSLK